MRIRDIALIVVFSCFICGPALLVLLEGTGIQLPVTLTSKPAKYLSGGVREVDILESLSLHAVLDETLQNDLETELGNHVPLKAQAMIASSSLQRLAIKASNFLFEFDCYPTFFGSTRLAIPEFDAVTYLPAKKSTSLERKWEDFAKGVKRVASKYSNKRFIIYVVQGYDSPAYNPAYALSSNPIVPSDCIDCISEIIDETRNVQLITQSFNSGESYYSDFFTTDHHWNINGAFRAYDQITEQLGIDSIDPGSNWIIPDYLYCGATARWGLDLIDEQVFDCSQNFKSLKVIMEGGNITTGDDHDSFWDYPEIGRKYKFYDSYYDNLGHCTIIGSGNRSALLIGNSYIGAIQRPLGFSYGKLTVNNQLHPASKLENTLEDQIRDAEADDVIFVANPSNLVIDKKYFKLN